ncbi:MAG: oxidoreductase domain protein [uncultured Thermomicrobiales bacterium]|uniref:Oxidoreductase domain protein n=1 Tax=uncultured Thermomicrobiales bacterium TaxID=1645740 RepID=A0A6J4TVA1_9BACT|nr:MAG: oxidoreductase domain protein [uncultured Thermomicrobiales bacterium]
MDGGTVRVGLVGCGGVAGWHAGNLGGIAGVEIAGLADPNDESVRRIKAAVPALAGVPAFGSAEELYAAVALDAVEINTPHTLHHGQVLEALDHGLHVLCEKPMACSPEDARAIADRAALGDRLMTVSYQRRVDPAYSYLRRVVASGELGEIQTASVTVGQNWKSLTAGSWRQDPSLSGGGMLMDSGSHLVEALLALTGQPVAAVAATVDDAGSPVDINATALVRFAGGAQGQITVIGDLATVWIERVLVSGTGGVLVYETDPQHPWRTGRVQHYRDGTVIQPLGLPAPFPSMDAAWIAAIRGTAENPAPAEIGVAVADLTDAIYRAARTGQVVEPTAAVLAD